MSLDDPPSGARDIPDIIRQFHTKSGSIYEVNITQKLIRGSTLDPVDRKSRRLTDDWNPYEAIFVNLHGGLTVYWGTGRDAHSDSARQDGAVHDKTQPIQRLSETTEIQKVVLETGHELDVKELARDLIQSLRALSASWAETKQKGEPN